MREIDITKENINCWDELMIEEDGISAEYELWMDVDKYFDTNTKDTDGWINFYTIWKPDNDMECIVILDNIDELTSIPWELTLEEKKFFKEMMEKYCQETTGMSLDELWNKKGDQDAD